MATVAMIALPRIAIILNNNQFMATLT